MKAEVLRHWYKKNTAVKSLKSCADKFWFEMPLLIGVYKSQNTTCLWGFCVMIRYCLYGNCLVLSCMVCLFWMYNQLFLPLDWCRVSAVCKGVLASVLQVLCLESCTASLCRLATFAATCLQFSLLLRGFPPFPTSFVNKLRFGSLKLYSKEIMQTGFDSASFGKNAVILKENRGCY